jgi:Fe2+ or Zn2+ uptake regulation protein
LVYIITSEVQADKRLTQIIWEILTEMWKRGEREVDSGDVLKVLKKRGENIQPGAMRRVFDFLINSGCIRAAKFKHPRAVTEHGAMTITWLHPHCPEIES